jgi:hypothetical protein
MKTYSDFYKGISRSRYDQTGFDSLTNCDVHSELGLVQPQLALAEDSATPNENCIGVTAPNGDVYFFSKSSGKTWKRAVADGSYSLVNTNANGAHCGAGYFNGKIYYSTSTKLGHYDLSSTWTDTYQTWSQTSTYRPMYEMNLSLFIGNGKYLASIDGGATFADNSLDLPSNYSITTLTGVGTDLLIGTIIGTNVSMCKVFLWDTYSSSWTVEDDVPEIGINTFIPMDNITIAQCGTAGNLYYWTGARMEKLKKLRSVTTSANHYAAAILNGKSLFATGTKIFSFHREDKDMPLAIVQEYTASGTVASIVVQASQLFVSTGSNIQKIGTSYATATIITPEIQESFQNVLVNYDAYAAGIAIATNPDGAGYTTQTAVVDSNRKIVHFDGGLGTVNYGQVRITLTPSGTDVPKIKAITLI